MGTKVQFIVHDHHAKRAGYHQDLRFQDPLDRRRWYSFAVPKKVPLKPDVKVLAIRTHMHLKDEALFQGEIPSGEYGSGTIIVFDQGVCRIEKITSAHIVILFQGSKVKGLYHFVSLGNVKKSKFKQQQYLLFKSKKKDFEPLKLGDTEISKYLATTGKFQEFSKGRIA